MRRIMIIFMVLCFVQHVVAQTDCPTIVDAAFAATNDVCASLARNQACYGNLLLDATPHADVADFSFEQSGDIVNVADIDSLQLSSMSLADETWGIALMLLQANLPDTLPGQNVTMLLFGDVQLSNAVAEVIELDGIANSGVNVRLRPRTDQNNIIGSLTQGQTVTANGRLEDGSWIRIIMNADTNEVGWVSADFVTSDTDLDALPIVEAGEPLYTPMQAFYFASAIGDSQCSEAPNSGILIQTPQGAGEIDLRVNEVDIRLGSTVFLTAGNGFMTIYVVEGQATVSAGGVSQTVPAGTYTQIPLNSNGIANGTPAFPQPYNIADVQALPVSISLPQSVTIAPPLPADEIDAAINTADGLPTTGTWSEFVIVTENTCNPDELAVGSTTGPYNVTLTFSDDRSTFAFDGYTFGTLTFTRVADNVYVSSVPSITWTITFHSATSFTNAWRGVNGDPSNGGCIYSQDATGTYVGND